MALASKESDSVSVTAKSGTGGEIFGLAAAGVAFLFALNDRYEHISGATYFNKWTQSCGDVYYDKYLR